MEKLAMRRSFASLPNVLVFASILLLTGFARIAPGENWPCWRGPRGDGTSHEQTVPVSWDGESGKNIVWKVPVPGYGHASPIVWNDSIFTVTCLEDQQQRVLLCFDTKSGRLLWQKTVLTSPIEKKHALNSYASSTPATDGELVYVAFLDADFGRAELKGKSWKETTPGDMVVAAYDFDGNQKWFVRPGRFSSVHGFCSAPVLYKDLVIVNGDHDGDSYIVAVKRDTGETVWKTPRENKTRSYCTPIIREIGGRTQMVICGDKSVASYDPNNGKMHWIIHGPTEQFVASPVYNGKYILMTSGFPEFHILAIRPDGTGNVTNTHIVWRTSKGCAYVPSPIVEREYYVVISDTGIGTCFEAETGRKAWTRRMGPHFSASLTSALGNVYFLGDDGTMTIVRPGEEYEQVAQNSLGERCFASPAFSNGAMYLRGEENLYRVEEREENGGER
jgi:outer membrane protein assembly factor BamB